MGKQTGVLPIKATIDNITFYKSKDGDMVKKKSAVSGAAIKSKASYQRTRENNAEFGRAGQASKVLRTALNRLLQQGADHRLHSRLVTCMMKVIHADASSIRGQRNVIDGEAVLLKGFEFNGNAPLSACFVTDYKTGIDRETGKMTVDIPTFIPEKAVKWPAGATHFKLITGGAEVDFENAAFTTDINDSGYLPLDNKDTAVIQLVNNVTAKSTHPLFLILGIEFYQESNGGQYSLNSGSFNALCIVNVDGGV